MRDKRHSLSAYAYLAGEYSIADVCTYPWIAGMAGRLPAAAELGHVHAWAERIGARPAVQKGMAIP